MTDHKQTIDKLAREKSELLARVEELERWMAELKGTKADLQSEALDRAAEGIGKLDICYGCRDTAVAFVLGLKEPDDG